MFETWYQMTARHKRERRDLVERLAAERITQTQAARRLNMSLQGLNNFIQRTGIYWPVIHQGKRQ